MHPKRILHWLPLHRKKAATHRPTSPYTMGAPLLHSPLLSRTSWGSHPRTSHSLEMQLGSVPCLPAWVYWEVKNNSGKGPHSWPGHDPVPQWKEGRRKKAHLALTLLEEGRSRVTVGFPLGQRRHSWLPLATEDQIQCVGGVATGLVLRPTSVP